MRLVYGSAVALSLAVGLTILIQRRRARGSRVLAVLPSAVSRVGWYRHIVVTDCSHQFACNSSEVVRGLHLGSAENPPESLVRLRKTEAGWIAVPDLTLKSYSPFTLVAFAWLEDGFAYEDARALLIGVAGGSLLHFWRSCVPGSVCIDAVELDAAVLQAARSYLALDSCERDGQVRCHVADGAAYVRGAEDEVYDLVVCDLDMGSLLDQPREAIGATRPGQLGGRHMSEPARHLYRVLTSRGVLVLNMYSEEPLAERMQAVLTSVRSLRRFFPEVHVLRVSQSNTLLFAPVERSADPTQLFSRAASSAERLGLGVDLGRLLQQLPSNRHQCYN